MRKIIAVFFCVFLAFSVTANAEYREKQIYEKMNRAFAWMEENVSPLGYTDSVAADYYVMALSRVNRTFDYNKYSEITEARDTKTLRDASRTIMANSASGGNLNKTFVLNNTCNADIKNNSERAEAIIALCGGDFKAEINSIKGQRLVADLLRNQANDGSFDNDIKNTSKAIIALSFLSGNLYALDSGYKDELLYFDVNASILRAVDYLQKKKDDGCGFGNIPNTAYAIMAIDAAGIDAGGDIGYSNADGSTVSWLLVKQRDDGSFSDDTNENALALCAMVSHMRAMQGKSAFFDFTQNDRLDNPTLFDEEINRSGEGLKRETSTEAIRVRYDTEENDETLPPSVPNAGEDDTYDAPEENNRALPMAVVILSIILFLVIIYGFYVFVKRNR